MAMDISEIRLKNLEIILSLPEFGGKKAALATKMGVAANNLSRYFGKGVHRRKISDDTARLIESAAGKPTGWMDLYRDGDDEGSGIKIDPATDEVYHMIQELNPEDRERVVRIVRSFLKPEQ